MELKNVCKSFGENDVLRDVSLVIPKGSRVLISAPSGRGKTTLLRIMMGLEKPDSGEIIIDSFFTNNWGNYDYCQLTEEEIKKDHGWAWKYAKRCKNETL